MDVHVSSRSRRRRSPCSFRGCFGLGLRTGFQNRGLELLLAGVKRSRAAQSKVRFELLPIQIREEPAVDVPYTARAGWVASERDQQIMLDRNRYSLWQA